MVIAAAVCARRLYTLNKMQKSLIDETALRLLACPVCHAGLALPDGGEDAETVLCTGCGRRYPIRDGLPVLLAAAASR
jgi:uncharacterized protein YbaR (Trm112 family)